MELTTDEGTVTVVGSLSSVGEGQRAKFSGKYISHPRFGVQFKAESFETELPEAKEDIALYLCSGLFEGIGPQTAARIAGRFGADTFDVIENAPERLTEIKGMTPKKAKKLAAEYRRLLEIKPIILFFGSYGLSAQNAVDAYYAYGSDVMRLVRSDPYILMEDAVGIPFKKCDELAFDLGIDREESVRINAALRYILKHNLGNGHTFLPKDKLIAACASAMGVDPSLAKTCLDNLIEDGKLSFDGDIGGLEAVYLPEYYEAEKYLSSRITALARAKKQRTATAAEIAESEKKSGLVFNDDQKRAVDVCINSGISVLNGGPGTGKTTTLLCILDVLEALDKKILLAAPTGRAAKRMEELTGREAKTIHRLLEMERSEKNVNVFKKNEDDMLKGDYIIIDESSMADVLLMTALFKAMPDGMSLILVGDADQLPPVSAGNFFGNVVASGCVKTVTLTEIFRQAAESGIITASHEIIKGKAPSLDNNSKDFFYIRRETETEICATIADLCARRLPERYGLDPFSDIQVIGPTRKTRCGTEYLNAVLQNVLNGESREEKGLAANGYTFVPGDKVMQIENDYDILWTRSRGEAGSGIYNGDIGVVTAVDRTTRTVTVRFDDKTAVYAYDMIAELEPAFAVTVHKSQGSEFRAVIMPVFDAPKPLLNRCLLYTAVTRAKELFIFVGKSDIIDAMVENGRANVSYCGLKYLLKRRAEK